MRRQLASAVLIACLGTSAPAQSPVPNLTRQQREMLLALVAATDAAATQPPTPDVTWQSHLMRASDGSHYVAFRIEPPRALPVRAGAALIYVRLATSLEGAAQPVAERSSVREWLAGTRTDPRLLPPRNIAPGEMPTFGPGSTAARGSTASTGSNDLKLMALERERQKQEQQDRGRQRRAELQGLQTATRDLLPFEDFDLAGRITMADGQPGISRALTTGPGDYDLYVAWADLTAPNPATTAHVIRRPLHLPAARTAGLSTGSVILASSVVVRAGPYPPTEQASHPYSIGLMEITPSRSSRYSRDGRLSVAFQVINAEANDTGMPDVAVAFRIVRVAGDRESPVASLNPQSYNATTLPPDFNIRLGHPLFAAVSAPLASLTRGDYRLKIVVNDKIAGTSTAADADFSIIATPASLLAEAPPLGPPFKRDTIFEPSQLAAIITALTPATSSAALSRALQVAATGKFVDLLVEEPVSPAEAGVRTALTGLAFLSIADASAATHFQRALDQGAPPGPTEFLLGSARALQSRDTDAIAAFQAAAAAGHAPPLTAQFLAEALLRRHEFARAAEIARELPRSPRLGGAIAIGTQRENDAAALLDTHLADHSDDQDARWLMLHALYAQFVKSGKPMAAAERDKFTTHARAYINAKGVNAALASEWMNVISSS
jgi:hypothetical protein